MTLPSIEEARFLPETLLVSVLGGQLQARGHEVDRLTWLSPHLDEGDFRDAIQQVRFFFPAWRPAAAEESSLRARVVIHMDEVFDRSQLPMSESERQIIAPSIERMCAAGFTAQVEQMIVDSVGIIALTPGLSVDA